MRVLIAIGGLLAICNSALAADIFGGPNPPPPPAYPQPAYPQPYYAPPPAPPPFTWSGVYIGSNGGAGFANGTATASIGGVSATSSATLIGGIAGAQIGGNYQAGAFVLGVEADAQWSGQSNTTTTSCGFACSVSGTVTVPWFATARLRAGPTIDRIFLYGTGGLAVSGVTDTATATIFGTTFDLADLSATNVGWTIGGGVEAAVGYNLSVKVEYLFMRTNFSASGPVALLDETVTETGTINDSIVRVGVNYRFPLGPGGSW